MCFFIFLALVGEVLGLLAESGVIVMHGADHPPSPPRITVVAAALAEDEGPAAGPGPAAGDGLHGGAAHLQLAPRRPGPGLRGPGRAGPPSERRARPRGNVATGDGDLHWHECAYTSVRQINREVWVEGEGFERGNGVGKAS